MSGSIPAEEIRLSVGGDALNEATILARLGAEVFLQTVIGEDTAGQVILRHCRNCGISLLGHPVRTGLETGINVVLIQANGSGAFSPIPLAVCAACAWTISRSLSRRRRAFSA